MGQYSAPLVALLCLACMGLVVAGMVAYHKSTSTNPLDALDQLVHGHKPDLAPPDAQQPALTTPNPTRIPCSQCTTKGEPLCDGKGSRVESKCHAECKGIDIAKWTFCKPTSRCSVGTYVGFCTSNTKPNVCYDFNPSDKVCVGNRSFPGACEAERDGYMNPSKCPAAPKTPAPTAKGTIPCSSCGNPQGLAYCDASGNRVFPSRCAAECEGKSTKGLVLCPGQSANCTKELRPQCIGDVEVGGNPCTAAKRGYTGFSSCMRIIQK